jgi:DNA-binding CsgD family transcriptional regulator
MLLHDDPVRAIHVLERALAGYEQAGSERDAARVRSRLGRRALATGARHDRRRAATGWESLTEAQRRVALVVGSGMTNAKAADRLSVSRHTVDSHLRQVFGKLDINSRAQLVRLTVQRGEPADAETWPESSTGREPSPGPASGMLIGLPDAPSFRRTWSPRDP